MASTNSSDGAFVLLHNSDNILVCARPAPAGSIVEIDGGRHVIKRNIPIGHKIARRSLRNGDKVLRYGVSIGSMTADAEPGDHVHSHNLKSDYISAHSRNAVHISESQE